MKTSEVLNRAADLIQEQGWARGPGGWKGRGGGLCIEGGILAALGKNWGSLNVSRFQNCPSYRAVVAYLELPHNELWAWNDNQGSSRRVIEVLRACALVEASRERSPWWRRRPVACAVIEASREREHAQVSL